MLCLMWTNYWCIVVLEHWVLHREYLDCGFEPWQAELTPEIWITGSAYTSVLRLQVVCLLPSPFIKPPFSFLAVQQAQSEDSSICDCVTDWLDLKVKLCHKWETFFMHTWLQMKVICAWKQLSEIRQDAEPGKNFHVIQHPFPGWDGHWSIPIRGINIKLQ